MEPVWCISELRMGRAGLRKTSPWENSLFLGPAHALARQVRPMGVHGLITRQKFLSDCIFNLKEMSWFPQRSTKIVFKYLFVQKHT